MATDSYDTDEPTPNMPAAGDPTVSVAGPVVEDPEYQPGQNLAEPAEARLPGFLQSVAYRVCANTKGDRESAAPHMKVRSKHLRMFAGDIPGKIGSDEQANITYVHLPYLTKSILQFHAKYQVSYFPATGDFVGAKSELPSRSQQMRKVTRHLNLQLRKQIPEYIPEQDQGALATLLFGSMFDVWWYDPIEDRPCTQFISSDDFVAPYSEKCRTHDMSDLPRKCWVKRQYRRQIEQLVDRGHYSDVLAKLYPQPLGDHNEPGKERRTENTADQPVREAANKLQGVSPSPNDEDAPRVVYECDMWLVLPGLNRQRLCTVVVDEATKEVLRLALCEKDDPKDAQRYMQERAAYDAELDTLAATLNINDPAALEAAHAAQGGMQKPAPPKRVPWHRFTHHWAIPNPEGFYQYGLGALVAGYNEVADDVISRVISALTLSVLGTLLYSKDVRGAERGDFVMKLGEPNAVDLPPQQVKDAFVPLNHPVPDLNGAFRFESRMSEAVESITADDIIGGGQGKSGETATTTDIRSSNAMDSISVIGARYTRARSQSLQNLVYINSQHLQPTRIALSSGLPGEVPEEFDVSADDYVEQFDIEFTADPNMASRPQRQNKAVKLFQQLLQVPPDIATDPTPFRTVLKGAIVNMLEEMERPDLAAIMATMQVAPPPPQMPGAPAPGGPPPQGAPDNAAGPPAPTEPVAAQPTDRPQSPAS